MRLSDYIAKRAIILAARKVYYRTTVEPGLDLPRDAEGYSFLANIVRQLHDGETQTPQYVTIDTVVHHALQCREHIDELELRQLLGLIHSCIDTYFLDHPDEESIPKQYLRQLVGTHISILRMGVGMEFSTGMILAGTPFDFNQMYLATQRAFRSFANSLGEIAVAFGWTDEVVEEPNEDLLSLEAERERRKTLWRIRVAFGRTQNTQRADTESEHTKVYTDGPRRIRAPVDAVYD